MNYLFDYKPYSRKLKKPLKAYYGEMWERRGFIIRLEDEEGRVGYGDVAPFPYFGTENLEQAFQYLSELNGNLFNPKLKNFPCVQFGLESARWMLEGNLAHCQEKILPVTALLSSGKEAIEDIQKYLNQGYQYFKWKICTEINELSIFEELIKLAPNQQFRLDANGGLNKEDLPKWLEFEQIEYIEQPLPPGEEVIMKTFGNKIALDESTLRVEDMEKVEVMNWEGYVVVKPSLMGNIDQFIQFRNKSSMKFIYSSAIESTIGMTTGIVLASQDANNFALGYGVNSYFDSDIFGTLPIRNGNINIKDIININFNDIWSQL